MNEEQPKYFGKYRGEVVNNVDVEGQGRVLVKVEGLLEGAQNWAMPCMPYGGSGKGFFAVPEKGARVWVEFERGDLNKPIYSGCFWEKGEAPAKPPLPTTKIWKTNGVSVKLDDLPGGGGLTIEVASPSVPVTMKAVFNASGIEISHGGKAKITLGMEGITLSFGKNTVELGMASVKVNGGALEVV